MAPGFLPSFIPSNWRLISLPNLVFLFIFSLNKCINCQEKKIADVIHQIRVTVSWKWDHWPYRNAIPWFFPWKHCCVCGMRTLEHEVRVCRRVIESVCTLSSISFRKSYCVQIFRLRSKVLMTKVDRYSIFSKFHPLTPNWSTWF